jgi:VanZ family protein
MMMIVTFVFGTDHFSAENTRPIIRWLMAFFFGRTSSEMPFASGEGFLRKSAHFLEYGLLAFLWFRALRGGNEKTWRWAWAGAALLATAVWASVDELQQGLISTQRTGSPWDVLLDSSGAATALLLVGLCAYIRR